MSENKKTLKIFGQSLLICAFLAIGFVLTDICFFADGFKDSFLKGEYANLANYCFYLIGFTSIVLYGLFFYKKSPAFFRGLLIFSACFFALMIGTKISLLSYDNVFAGIASVNRIIRFLQIGGMIVFAAIAILIGMVASRLSKKQRNLVLLIVATVLAWINGIVMALVSLFLVKHELPMSVADVCACLTDLVPAIYMTVIAMSFVTGSEARHNDDPMLGEE